MAAIEEGIVRALQTRPIPQGVPARVRFLWEKVAKEDTKALAKIAGISVRTAQRWAKALKDGVEPTMSKANEKKLEQTVRKHWQPRVKNRLRKQAEQSGFILHASARFGYTASKGSTDDPRQRIITQHLPGSVAKQLFAAHAQGAGEQRLGEILADGLGEAYFKDAGQRAQGLGVEFNDVQWLDLDI